MKHMLQSEEVTQKSIFDSVIFSSFPHLHPQRKVISATPTPLAAIQEAKEVTRSQLRTLQFGDAAVVSQLIPPSAKSLLLFIIK